jgi:hypothetical protein
MSLMLIMKNFGMLSTSNILSKQFLKELNNGSFIEGLYQQEKEDGNIRESMHMVVPHVFNHSNVCN